MLGFEMAYVASGSYYLASAQQVIAQEERGRLTEILPRNEPYTQMVINNDTHDGLSIKEPVVIHFPFDSDVPYYRDKVIEDLKAFKGRSVDISGFASKEGASSYNKSLSKKRALRVAKIAKKLGVKVKSIKAIGELECNTKSKKQLPRCRKVEVEPVGEKALP
ncbi:MAG: OmpA family protein [Sulfurimonas sp.]|jgi:outer membrane protein OmpA-like peptidoglycan-associated protein